MTNHHISRVTGYNEGPGITNDILQPNCGKTCRKEPRYKGPRYNDHILPVPWHFIILGIHCNPKVPMGQNLSELYMLSKKIPLAKSPKWQHRKCQTKKSSVPLFAHVSIYSLSTRRMRVLISKWQ